VMTTGRLYLRMAPLGIKPGEEILFGNGRRFRVVDVVRSRRRTSRRSSGCYRSRPLNCRSRVTRQEVVVAVVTEDDRWAVPVEGDPISSVDPCLKNVTLPLHLLGAERGVVRVLTETLDCLEDCPLQLLWLLRESTLECLVDRDRGERQLLLVVAEQPAHGVTRVVRVEDLDVSASDRVECLLLVGLPAGGPVVELPPRDRERHAAARAPAAGWDNIAAVCPSPRRSELDSEGMMLIVGLIAVQA